MFLTPFTEMWFRGCIFNTSFPQELKGVVYLQRSPAAGPQPCHCLAHRLWALRAGVEQEGFLRQFVHCSTNSYLYTRVPLCSTEAAKQRDWGVHLPGCCCSGCQTGTEGTDVGNRRITEFSCFLHEKLYVCLYKDCILLSPRVHVCLGLITEETLTITSFPCLDAIGKHLKIFHL